MGQHSDLCGRVVLSDWLVESDQNEAEGAEAKGTYSNTALVVVCVCGCGVCLDSLYISVGSLKVGI